MMLAGPQHVLFVFVDGIGLGRADAAVNPLAGDRFKGLERLSADQPWTEEAEAVDKTHHVFRPIDPVLGYPGLPQSGTGQATLFTGIDCIKPVGRHFGPFPHSKHKDILRQNNVFERYLTHANGQGETVAFANAYPEIFFAENRKRRRWTVTTFCCDVSGVRLRTGSDLKEGKAISAGLTRSRWNTVGLQVPEISPRQAADDLYALSQQHRFTLFEYFLTDKAGHNQSKVQARAVLHDLSALLGRLRDRLDFERDLLIVTSDHGNIEDLSLKTHTRNPVPLITIGHQAQVFNKVQDLTGVVPTLLGLTTEAH